LTKDWIRCHDAPSVSTLNYLAWILLSLSINSSSTPSHSQSLNDEDVVPHESHAPKSNSDRREQDQETGDSEQEPSRSHLIILVLAFIFIIVAGSISLYRYMQRMEQKPVSRHAWMLRPKIAKPAPELLSTSQRSSIIKSWHAG
jgi:hypothetical protein